MTTRTFKQQLNLIKTSGQRFRQYVQDGLEMARQYANGEKSEQPDFDAYKRLLMAVLAGSNRANANKVARLINASGGAKIGFDAKKKCFTSKAGEGELPESYANWWEFEAEKDAKEALSDTNLAKTLKQIANYAGPKNTGDAVRHDAKRIHFAQWLVNKAKKEPQFAGLFAD